MGSQIHNAFGMLFAVAEEKGDSKEEIHLKKYRLLQSRKFVYISFFFLKKDSFKILKIFFYIIEALN